MELECSGGVVVGYGRNGSRTENPYSSCSPCNWYHHSRISRSVLRCGLALASNKPIRKLCYTQCDFQFLRIFSGPKANIQFLGGAKYKY